MDLQGYFPKAMMNKIQASIILDQGNVANKIYNEIKNEA